VAASLRLPLPRQPLRLGDLIREPSTWAMMLIGFAGLGFAGYRRAVVQARPGAIAGRVSLFALPRHQFKKNRKNRVRPLRRLFASAFRSIGAAPSQRHSNEARAPEPAAINAECVGPRARHRIQKRRGVFLASIVTGRGPSCCGGRRERAVGGVGKATLPGGRRGEPCLDGDERRPGLSCPQTRHGGIGTVLKSPAQQALRSAEKGTPSVPPQPAELWRHPRTAHPKTAGRGGEEPIGWRPHTPGPCRRSQRLRFPQPRHWRQRCSRPKAPAIGKLLTASTSRYSSWLHPDGVPGSGMEPVVCVWRYDRFDCVPSLPRRYPASAVLRTSPPPHSAQPLPRGRPVDHPCCGHSLYD
jgi:hypothetical protein